MLEVREEVVKGKKKTFLYVLLIYYNNNLFLSWITLSPTTWSTKKRKIQKKKKSTLSYT